MFKVEMYNGVVNTEFYYDDEDCANAFAAGLRVLGRKVKITAIDTAKPKFGALSVELANIPLEKLREYEDMIYEWAAAEDVTAIVSVS